MFRAADVVQHTPTGEKWILACDEERGEVMPCGWPETLAQATDCVLVKAADDVQREEMLRHVGARHSGMRGARAARQYEALHPFTAEMSLGANIQALFPERKLDLDMDNIRELLSQYNRDGRIVDTAEPDVFCEVRFNGPVSVMRVGETGVSLGGQYNIVRKWYMNPRSKGMVADDGYVFNL